MSPREREYRLVPYDVDDHKDQVRVVDIGRSIWNARIWILKVILLVALYGAWRSLAAPEQFTSATSITPITQEQSQLPSLLQQFGGMIDGGLSGGVQEQIPVQMYTEILYSTPAMLHLIHHPVQLPDNGKSVTLMEYMLEHHRPSLLARVSGTLLDYTLHLPFTLTTHLYRSGRHFLSWILGESPEDSTVLRDKPLPASPDAEGSPEGSRQNEVAGNGNDLQLDQPSRLTLAEAEFIDDITDRVTTNLNAETGLFHLEVTLPDPEIAAQVNQTLLNFLTTYVTEMRTRKAARNLAFAEERTREAEVEFEEAQERLADYQDSNVALSTARALAQEQRLTNDMQLKFELYNMLRQREEEARLQLEEQTPVFNYLEPVSVPPGRSAPRRVLMVVVFGIVGGFLATLWVLIRGGDRTPDRSPS